MAPFKGHPVITFHRSWSYLLDWLSLRSVAELEPKPGIPPTPGHVARLIALMRRDSEWPGAKELDELLLPGGFGAASRAWHGYARGHILPAGAEPDFRDMSGNIRIDQIIMPESWVGERTIKFQRQSGSRIAWIDRRERVASVPVSGQARTDAVIDLPYEVQVERVPGSATPEGIPS